MSFYTGYAPAQYLRAGWMYGPVTQGQARLIHSPHRPLFWMIPSSYWRL